VVDRPAFPLVADAFGYGDGKSHILYHQVSTDRNFIILMNGKRAIKGGMSFVKSLGSTWGVVHTK